MAITSYGYDGSIDEATWAQVTKHLGADYAVSGAGDLAVTVSANYGISVAAGTGWGRGVMDVNSGAVALTSSSTTGTRYDLVALRRNWATNTSSIVLIQGTTATKIIPATRNATPGNLDDQPLALIKFVSGNTTATEITDLRTWPTKVYGANDLLGLPDATTGAEAVVGNYRYRMQANGTWLADPGRFGRMAINTLSGWFTPNDATWVVIRADGRYSGNDVDLYLELQRVTSSLQYDANGQMAAASSLIGTINDTTLRPNVGYRTVSAMVRGGANTGATGFYGTHAFVQSGGSINLSTGVPSFYINPTAAGVPALWLHAHFTRGDALLP